MPAFSSYHWVPALTPGSTSEGRSGPWKSNSGFFFKPWYQTLKNSLWGVATFVLDLFYASCHVVPLASGSDAWFKSCDASWELSMQKSSLSILVGSLCFVCMKWAKFCVESPHAFRFLIGCDAVERLWKNRRSRLFLRVFPQPLDQITSHRKTESTTRFYEEFCTSYTYKV